ncbi:hypothetical protein MTO96_008178 [Rhipicephalus appendiculatus]
MEVHVEGEYITQDELTAEMGWHTSRSRRPAGRRGRNSSPSDSPQTQESGSKPNPKKNVKAQVLKAGRMPPLPKDEIKIILRPKGGLHISKVGSPTVTAAIFDATKITPAESQEDTICPNAQQNIIVISTPPPAQRRPIHSAQDIDANVVNARNPLALATKRIGTTTTVVIAFDGPSVPFQERQLEQFFSLFYLSINAGSLLSTFITPILRVQRCLGQMFCFPLAFGVPAALMVLALVFFMVGKPLYRIVPPGWKRRRARTTMYMDGAATIRQTTRPTAALSRDVEEDAHEARARTQRPAGNTRPRRLRGPRTAMKRLMRDDAVQKDGRERTK